jgi:hypothetical protein
MDDQRSTQGSTTAESGTWGDPELRERIARAMHADTEGIEPLGAAEAERAAARDARRARPTRS